MRQDFSKVLVERQRGGMRGDRRGQIHYNRAVIERDPDAIPSFESTSRHRGGTKYLNEHLGPLRRFLRASLGRPWNEVHAELSVHVNRHNPVQAHVFQHLHQYVEVNTSLRRGVIVDSMGRELRRNYAQRSFYVCPVTAILKALPVSARKCREPRTPSASQRFIGALMAYRSIDEAWFQVWFERLPSDPREVVFDVVLGRAVRCDYIGHDSLFVEYGHRGIYAVRKLQIGKREIRRERLRPCTPQHPVRSPAR